jgi:hypothetical protein
LPGTSTHAHLTRIIWGATVGLAVAHWFAFRVSARLVGAGSADHCHGVGDRPAHLFAVG